MGTGGGGRRAGKEKFRGMVNNLCLYTHKTRMSDVWNVWTFLISLNFLFLLFQVENCVHVGDKEKRRKEKENKKKSIQPSVPMPQRKEKQKMRKSEVWNACTFYLEFTFLTLPVG